MFEVVVASVVIVSLVADVVSGLVAGSVVLEIVVPSFFVVLLPLPKNTLAFASQAQRLLVFSDPIVTAINLKLSAEMPL